MEKVEKGYRGGVTGWGKKNNRHKSVFFKTNTQYVMNLRGEEKEGEQ